MKFTFGFTSVLTLGLALGCNAANGKKETGETKEGGTEVPDQDKPNKLGESGDQANEDSPDSQFYAEQYVLDGFETDDAEAFEDDGASLALTEDTAAPADGTVGETDEQVVDNEVEEVVTPPSDEDPTANDKKLVDLIAEFIMGIADADGDGALSKTEFVDTRYFPELQLSAEVLARITERRGKIFDAYAGADASMSQEELIATFDKVGGNVKKLRVLRYLPYADHLAAAWKLKKKDFDADGDGKLDEAELQKLREARQETKHKRRVAVLAANYGLCQKFVEAGGVLPDWFKDLQERWNKKIEKKETFKDKFGDKFKKKAQNQDQTAMTLTSLATGDDTGSGTGTETGSGTGSETGSETGSDDEADVATAGSEADVCAPILDRAESFGMSTDVLTILKDRGVIQE